MDILKTNMGEWVIQVENGMKAMTDGAMANASEQLDMWKKRFIYKVPKHVLETNEKYYEPQEVSLGPYHYNDAHLQGMEEHKKRALCHFLKRSETRLDSLFQALSNESGYLKEAYDQLDPEWRNDSDKFLMLMIQDGCFILEVLNVYSRDVIYSPDDPIFGIHASSDKLSAIKRDMLLLQNQVPFRVVRTLFGVAEKQGQVGAYGNDKIPDELLYLLLRFFSTSTSSLSPVWSKLTQQPCLHLLDIYREVLLYDKIGPDKRKNLHAPSSGHADAVHFSSASKLYDSGIRFRRSSSTHLKDISFHGSILRFPPIIIAGETISTLANLMAFERIHAGVDNDVASYVFFMNCLIHNVNDVRLLESSGIIQNNLGSDVEVVKSLSLLSKDVHLGPKNSLDEVYKKVSGKLSNRVKKTLNQWWLDLFRTYFRTPWGALSVIAAIFLFTLASIQTVYTVLGYKRN